jgi:hypothetical protein
MSVVGFVIESVSKTTIVHRAIPPDLKECDRPAIRATLKQLCCD